LDRILTVLTLGILRFFIVNQGYVRLITEFGRYVRTVKAGMGSCLSFWGLYQKPGPEIPILEQIGRYKSEEVFTSDGVKCLIDVVIWFTVSDPVKATFAVSDYKEAVFNAVRSTLRNECGKRPMRALLSGREEIISNLKKVLETDAAPWGINVRLVEMTNIDITQTK
jgi:regulator of protease activity HflC (stomatin/prohibitin superfamily)